jgi:hypothetical protein
MRTADELRRDVRRAADDLVAQVRRKYEDANPVFRNPTTAQRWSDDCSDLARHLLDRHYPPAGPERQRLRDLAHRLGMTFPAPGTAGKLGKESEQ